MKCSLDNKEFLFLEEVYEYGYLSSIETLDASLGSRRVSAMKHAKRAVVDIDDSETTTPIENRGPTGCERCLAAPGNLVYASERASALISRADVCGNLLSDPEFPY